MEFRCRLASASGEILEGVYVADSEARLRHELEEKGLFVLSLQAKGAIGGVSFRLPLRQKINTREFLVFNQELATLLKAGMPLVKPVTPRTAIASIATSCVAAQKACAISSGARMSKLVPASENARGNRVSPIKA